MLKMSKMSNKSKVGRIALLPIFLPVWLLWVLFSGARNLFEYLEFWQAKVMQNSMMSLISGSRLVEVSYERLFYSC